MLIQEYLFVLWNIIVLLTAPFESKFRNESDKFSSPNELKSVVNSLAF
jgi:hypothetical protein